MKKIIYLTLIVVLFLFNISLAQPYVYQGIDLIKFEVPDGYTSLGQDMYEGEGSYGYFDLVAFVDFSDPMHAFKCSRPSAMKFQDIYRDIVKMMDRKEDINNDYIPTRGIGDVEYQATLIALGEAKYSRAWYIDNTYIIMLIYDEDAITLGSAYLKK